MMQQLYPQLEAVCRRFEELTTRLNQPQTAADPMLFRRLMQEYHDAEPVVQACRAWQTAQEKPCWKGRPWSRTSNRWYNKN